jgi:hypothetical protein
MLIEAPAHPRFAEAVSLVLGVSVTFSIGGLINTKY